MNRSAPSHTLYLSFSEFVWTALMALILVFAFSQNKAREESQKQKETIAQLQKDNRSGEDWKEALAAAERALDEQKKKNDELALEFARAKAAAEAKEQLEKEVAKLKEDNNRLAGELKAARAAAGDVGKDVAPLRAELEAERARANTLALEKADLTAKNTALEAEKAAWQEAKVQLENSLRKMTEEKETLQGKYDDLQKKYDALYAASADAQKAVGDLTAQLANANDRIAKLEAERSRLEATVQDLTTKLGEANKKVDELKAQIAAQDQNNEVQIDKAKKPLQDEIASLNDEIAKLRAEKEKIRKDSIVISRRMIDIKGELNKVICVVDCSSSMAFDNKWKTTREIISTWMSNLDIQRLMLVTYNKTPSCYPDDYRDVRKSLGGSNKNLDDIVNHLEGLTPQDYSNTYSALEEAYKHDPNTIILFTDGSPNKTSQAGADQREMERIIKELVEKHTGVHINIIAFGDYFNRPTGNYFRRITELTDGTFIGR